jgi:hypothetical protein
MPEIRREAVERGLVASIGETTMWRWLRENAIRPWHHRSWLFPSWPAACNVDGEAMADHHRRPHARPRQLAQPGRDLLLHGAAEGPDPNDLQSLTELQDRLLGSEKHYEQVAKRFEWKLTPRDLRHLLSKLDGDGQELRLAAWEEPKIHHRAYGPEY